MTIRLDRAARVLLITEGTYPYIVGGVSTWCDILVNGLHDVEWQLFPLTAGGMHRDLRFELPANAQQVGHLDLWSEGVHPLVSLGRRRLDLHQLPEELLRGLLGWESNTGALLDALVWCRRNPGRVRKVFRSSRSWHGFLDALDTLLNERHPETTEAPDLDVLQASELYQSLYWAARTAAFQTPEGGNAPDLCLVTAAGWSAIPAAVHRAIHGTPVVLVEHGVYVREAYLAAIRTGATASSRWVSTRLARGLSRLAYATADLVAPVTNANAAWERSFGVPATRIRTIFNGVLAPQHTVAPPKRQRVVTIGRIDGLKDVKTMLRTASHVLEQVPDAEFRHFGPVPEGQESYARECYALHRELGLGDRFRFMGSTSEPFAELEQADVSLLTSISEGFPMGVLEAMAAGRPVVATAVGGVTEAVVGCGFTAPPGDSEGLASGVVTLLRDPHLCDVLGRRGHARVERNFGQAACLQAYGELIAEMTGLAVTTPTTVDEPRIEATIDVLAEFSAFVPRSAKISREAADLGGSPTERR